MSSTPILSAQGLTRRFGGLTAVNQVDLQIQAGELIGLIGPNGAGKTTLFNLLMGLIKPSSGEVMLQGQRITGFKPHQVARLGMVKTFQNVALFPEMTVLDNVLTGGLLRLSLQDARELARQNLARVGMAHIADKHAADLTFPEKALVEMARALCTQPKVVLLDEVMAALNHAEMDQVLALIRKLREQDGLTFVVIEHHMRAIMNLCERILVLSFGQLIAQGTPQDISRNPDVISAYLGSDTHAGVHA
ncbi:MAG: ABC transporter ATP-binding protein [Limnohabitans sp.]|jgi:branched-chain amino acid transport system ATP-binding protein|nr:ABC transporter ATP-binding protein [Limnohabitans sp.]